MYDVEFLAVECRGTPTAMGRQHGEASRRLIQDHLAMHTFAPPEKLAAFHHAAAAILAARAPEILEEIHGIAEGALVDRHQLMALTFRNDDAERCTPMIVRNSPEGTLVAKNNDGPIHEMFPFVICTRRPQHGLPTIGVYFAGLVCGLDMMNAAGLANTHGSVGSIFPKPVGGLDIRLWAYRLMNTCRTTADFIAGLRQIPLGGKGFSIAVGDAEAETAFIDAAVPQVAVRDRNSAFDFSTNLYRSPGLGNADRRPADKRLLCETRTEYLRRQAPPQDLAGLQHLLRDHSTPNSPCRHAASRTTDSMIFLVHSGKALISSGPPCRYPYLEYSF
ncbi:MAG: hypothetical protein GX617_02220 [Lentisphaerae bacterium]|mgnify:CR=1 FL=1|nr:hypothetical protein [Lentisphaerota bacterium]